MSFAKIVPFPGSPLAYEELPDGTVLHPGMELIYRDEYVQVDERGCSYCHPRTPVLVYSSGERLCLCCGFIPGEAILQARPVGN